MILMLLRGLPDRVALVCLAYLEIRTWRAAQFPLLLVNLFEPAFDQTTLGTHALPPAGRFGGIHDLHYPLSTT